MGLGSIDTFTLKEARERARKYRQIVADGIDPIEDRRAKRDGSRAKTPARCYSRMQLSALSICTCEWKNDKHKQQWPNTLKTCAYPSIGSRPVAAIDGAVITDALESVWTKKPETARRVKQRIERVTQWVRDGMPLPITARASGCVIILQCRSLNSPISWRGSARRKASRHGP